MKSPQRKISGGGREAPLPPEGAPPGRSVLLAILASWSIACPAFKSKNIDLGYDFKTGLRPSREHMLGSEGGTIVFSKALGIQASIFCRKGPGLS